TICTISTITHEQAQALLAKMDQLEAQNRLLKADFTHQEKLTEALAKMATKLENLSIPTTSISTPTTTATITGSINITVRKFSGTDKNFTFKDFQTQIQLYFLNNAHLFTTPSNKMYFALSH